MPADFADRTLGVCVECRQKLLLDENGLCIHCELDRLREALAWKEVEIERYRKKNNELYAKLNAALCELATRQGERKTA